MINLVLFGPPGAGKGTQAEILEKKYGFLHLSTGEAIRHHIAEKTELGLQAESQMKDGGLVEDDLVCKIVASYVLTHSEGKGVIFDGFPRTTNQARRFDIFLEEHGQKVTSMIALMIPDEEIIKRILERAKSSGRADDQNPEIIRHRIETYKNQTAPVADFYAVQGKYHEIDGTGTIQEVNEKLCTLIDSMF